MVLSVRSNVAIIVIGRFQWPRGLRRGSTAACVVGLRVRVPAGAWMSLLNVGCGQG
jgi:hypothetical protein